MWHAIRSSFRRSKQAGSRALWRFGSAPRHANVFVTQLVVLVCYAFHVWTSREKSGVSMGNELHVEEDGVEARMVQTMSLTGDETAAYFES